MDPFDAASFLPATPAEGSFETRQQQEEEQLGGAASSPSRGTRAGAGNAGAIRCQQDCRHRRAKAYCARCCRNRGSVCPGHANTPHVPASSQQCSVGQQTTTLAASASTTAAAVDVEPIPNKRPRRTTALPSLAAAPTTTSSVDEPIATTTAGAALERFAREVSMDAVFRRVRLGGGPEPAEVAYYTTVTIAGHVFRGVLYDAGPHSGSTDAASESDTDGSGEGEVGSSLSTAAGSSLDLALGL